MMAFTDNPFEFLGDKPHYRAPVREIEVLSYDGNKFLRVKVKNQIAEVKASYVYANFCRFEDKDRIHLDLSKIPVVAVDTSNDTPKSSICN